MRYQAHSLMRNFRISFMIEMIKNWASMGRHRLEFMLHQLVFVAAIGQLLRAHSSYGKSDMLKSIENVQSKTGVITAKLIHRDHYFSDNSRNASLNYRETVERDAIRSKLRVQTLVKKTKNSETGYPEWETPLSDAASAEYLMEISLGTPPQSFVAVADTGSSLTWLQCGPDCQSCIDSQCGACQGSVFDPKKSSTYTPLPCSSPAGSLITGPGFSYPLPSRGGCEYSFSYFDGSHIGGNTALDAISLQTVTGITESFDFWFGCTHNVASSSGILQASDGVIGLSRDDLSFASQLSDHFGKIFGYCLVNRSISTTTVLSSPMFFGKAALTAIENGSPLEYTPMINSKSMYYVNCTGITLDLDGNVTTSIPANALEKKEDGSGGFIIDSGTTYTALPTWVFDILSEAIQQRITKYAFDDTGTVGFELCFLAQWNDWINDHGIAVPIISFLLSETSGFTLAVDTAWIRLDDKRVCLAMQGIENGASFLGNYQQVGYQIVYDLENEQIGFAKANCNVTDTGQPLEASTAYRTVPSLGSSPLTLPLSLLLFLLLTQ